MGKIIDKIVIKKDDEEIECEVLFNFDCIETGKSYIGYTDNTYGVKGRKNIYVSSYDPVVGTGKLEDIVNTNELKMVQNVLMQLDEENR